MTKVLILGAHGQIAQLARQQLLANTDAQLVLFLRNANRLTVQDADREQMIDGDAGNQADLEKAMTGVSVVYANLAGRNIEAQAKAVVAAMKATNVKRLIWISTLGIYDEVPGAYGKWNHQMLDDGYLQLMQRQQKSSQHPSWIIQLFGQHGWMIRMKSIMKSRTAMISLKAPRFLERALLQRWYASFNRQMKPSAIHWD